MASKSFSIRDSAETGMILTALSPGGTTLNSISHNNFLGKEYVRVGADVKGYRDLIKTHENASSVMSLDVIERSIKGLPLRYTRSRPNTSFYKTEALVFPHTSFYDPAVPFLDEALLESTAFSKYWQRLIAARNSWQSGEFIGELRKTADMVHRPAKALRSSAASYLAKHASLLRRKWKTARALSSAVSSLYLEYAFGWRPLVADANDAAAAWNALRDKSTITVRKTNGYAEDSVQFISPKTDWGSGQWYRYKQQDRHYIRTLVRYRGALKLNDNIAMGQALGLESHNILTTAWNLTPYSWLFDYFYNVEAILFAATFSDVLTAWSNSVLFQEIVATRRLIPDIAAIQAVNPTYTFDFKETQERSIELRRVHMYRRANAPSTVWPRVNCGIGWSRMLNVAALLAILYGH